MSTYDALSTVPSTAGMSATQSPSSRELTLGSFLQVSILYQQHRSEDGIAPTASDEEAGAPSPLHVAEQRPPLTWVTAELGSHCSLRPAMSHITDLAAVTRSGRKKDNVMSMSFKKCVSDPDLIL